jgi:hypothetical protein
MRSITSNRFLGGLFLGALCGVAMALGAVVTGFTLAQVTMTSTTTAREPTPTVEQLQRFLEKLTAPDPLPAPPPAPAWSVGGIQPTATAVPTNASGTPEPAMQSTTGGARATPFVPGLDIDDVTPQPTTTSQSAAVPTRTPFAPPTIVPILPLFTPAAR